MSEKFDASNITVSTGNQAQEQINDFNGLVDLFSAVFGVDPVTENVDFRQIIDAPVEEGKTTNKYGLTQSEIEELKIAFDNDNILAATAILKLKSQSQGVGPGNLSKDTITYIGQALGQGLTTDEILANLNMSGGLDRGYESKEGRMVTEIGPDGKPVPDPENPGAYKQKPFTSHFTKQVQFFINDLSTQEDIELFQNYLVANNIVSPEYWVGTEGEYSLALESAVTEIMAWFDANRYIDPNSTEMATILNDEMKFFTSNQYYEWQSRGVPGVDFEESPWAQDFEKNLKLFNHAVQEYGKYNTEVFDLAKARSKEQFIENLKKNYQVPSPMQRQEDVKDWFRWKLGREATPSEVRQWANSIAQDYSDNFREVSSNLWAMTESAKSEQWQADYLAGKPPPSFNQMTSLQNELAVEDPMAVQYADREQAYFKEIAAHEAGKRKKEVQSMVLRMMFGR